jgi:hypothetical protein
MFALNTFWFYKLSRPVSMNRNIFTGINVVVALAQIIVSYATGYIHNELEDKFMKSASFITRPFAVMITLIDLYDAHMARRKRNAIEKAKQSVPQTPSATLDSK